MTGGVREFSRPVVRELAIPRHTVKQIEAALASGARVVIVHGPPLAGVTNVLAQFAYSISAGPVLLIDAGAAPDALQFIANRLSRELSVGVSKDDLRNWLNTRKGLLDVTLAIDGLPNEGIEELVDFANAGLLRLVLGMGTDVCRQASAMAGRIQRSLVGRSASAIELLPLSDDEFYSACELLATSFGAYFFNGAQHVPDLRSARRLRAIAGTLPGVVAPAPEGATRETCLMIPPIPGPEMVETYGQSLAPEPALKHDLRKLGEAFLVDVSQHAADPDWVAATWGRPSVDPDILESGLGESRVKRLCELGFLSWVDNPDVGPRLLIRIEELLTQDMAALWAVGLASLKDPDAIRKEVGRLLGLTMLVPAGEVALASAIIQAARRDYQILGTVVPYLMLEKPTLSKLKDGARIDLLVKDARIRLEFGQGMDEQAIGNIAPWVVLSHLAVHPMAVEGYRLTLNYSIFMHLAVAPHLIIYPRPVEPAIAAGFHFHDFEGVGSVLCLNSGIVEPLVQAMMAHAHQSPQEFIWLAGQAMKEQNLHLGWRVLTAAMALRTSVEEEVANAAAVVESVLDGWWKQFLRAASEQHASSVEQIAGLPAPEPRPAGIARGGAAGHQVVLPREVTRVTIEEIADGDLAAGAKVMRFCDISTRQASVASGKIGRNDPCPCGSGRKFKRCHGKRW